MQPSIVLSWYHSVRKKLDLRMNSFLPQMKPIVVKSSVLSPTPPLLDGSRVVAGIGTGTAAVA